MEKESIILFIPTIGRLSSLLNTIKTFLDSNYKNISVAVIVDAGRKSYHQQIKEMLKRWNLQKKVFLFFNEKRLGWPRSMNKLFKLGRADYYFYGSDDLTFMKDTVLEAYRMMKEYFPEGDGLVGINQNLNKFCPAAFGLVGDRFVERFPDRQLFWPHYIHFCGDSELWHFAKSINRFKFAPRARVHHSRPMDEGKKLANQSLRRDRELWWKKKGKPALYWGKSFLKPIDLKDELPCRLW